MIQVERILKIAEIIANSYFGASRSDIRRELAESGDRVCDRTIFRYLKVFSDLGYIYTDVVYVHGKKTARYRSLKRIPRVLTGFTKESQ